MYLFSVLGVQAQPNGSTLVIGSVGGLTLLIAALIEMFVLVVGRRKGEERPDLAATTKDNRISLSGVKG